jgi:hypothetical protein
LQITQKESLTTSRLNDILLGFDLLGSGSSLGLRVVAATQALEAVLDLLQNGGRTLHLLISSGLKSNPSSMFVYPKQTSFM